MLGLILCRDDCCCALSPTCSWWWCSGWPDHSDITNFISVGGCFILVQGKPFQKMYKEKTWQEEKGFIITICNSDYNFGHYTGKHEPFLLQRDLFKKEISTRFIVKSQALHALTSQAFFAKGKKDVYIFIFLSLFVLAYFRNKDFHHFLFHICSVLEVWLVFVRKQLVPDFHKISPCSPLQQQRGVPREPTAAQHLTLIPVAAPRMDADDVVIGETASSGTHKNNTAVFGKLWKRRLLWSHLCLSRYPRRCLMVSEKHIFSLKAWFPSSDFIFRVTRLGLLVQML